MSIRFVHEWPLEETMVFENEYHSPLKLDLTDKYNLKQNSAEFIYIQDIKSGDLIGETYFIEIDKFDEPLPGLSD